MAVEVIGVGGEVNGHGDSIEAFRTANEQNARALLNVAEGKHKNTPRPAYDSRHADNQWPKMRYHAEKGEVVIGKNLKGIEDRGMRARIEKENQESLAAAEKQGWRAEPYTKPQIAVLDPATEKMELKRKLDEQQGQITALNDLLQKALAKLPT